MVVMGNDYGYMSINRDCTGYKLRQVFCKDATNQSPEQFMAEQPCRHVWPNSGFG
uniref:hypothetical protein n=1 Tax=Spirosoma agri TaxID=1987381 RepID=UPI00374431E2